jgi:hypothetical protein
LPFAAYLSNKRMKQGENISVLTIPFYGVVMHGNVLHNVSEVGLSRLKHAAVVYRWAFCFNCRCYFVTRVIAFSIY